MLPPPNVRHKQHAPQSLLHQAGVQIGVGGNQAALHIVIVLAFGKDFAQSLHHRLKLRLQGGLLQVILHAAV